MVEVLELTGDDRVGVDFSELEAKLALGQFLGDEHLAVSIGDDVDSAPIVLRELSFLLQFSLGLAKALDDRLTISPEVVTLDGMHRVGAFLTNFLSDLNFATLHRWPGPDVLVVPEADE